MVPEGPDAGEVEAAVTPFHTYTIPLGPVMSYFARKRFELLYMNEEIINPFWEACDNPACPTCNSPCCKSHRMYVAAPTPTIEDMNEWLKDWR